MKPRRVAVLIELETDMSIQSIKDDLKYILEGTSDTKIVQIQTNVMQTPLPKIKKVTIKKSGGVR